MPEFFFNFHPLEMTGTVIVLCTITSLFAGVIIAAVYTFHHVANKNFIVTLALLPVIVQSIIMLVNGQIGTGIAVMGAFSLVRFRSVPRTAKEITSIFLAMALGLAHRNGVYMVRGDFHGDHKRNDHTVFRYWFWGKGKPSEKP
jgi:hypothetical protein